MITLESLTALAADSEGRLWAEDGWTLHQTPNGGVRAVNGKLGRATASVPRITTLLGRLERGMFSYQEFFAFKKRHPP